MAKRRISDQQKRRIHHRQQQRREKSDQILKEISEHGLGPEQSGQVITNFGQSLIVEDASGKVFRCFSRQNLGSIVCGDRVIWQQDQKNENVGVIVAIEARETLLQKPGFGGKLKPMAANIDQIVIVSSILPEPNPYLIDRYLVAAENLPATPIVLFNKTDLLTSKNQLLIESIEAEYSNIGYQVIKTSQTLGSGFDALLEVLKNKTSIFVGLSGVGKSSLIKYLLPDQEMRIGEVSEATGEGKHTTTGSTLYHLPSGGELIDSPGVRDFGLWNILADDVSHGFKELQPYIGRCRFSNCAHQSEPDCAIHMALSDNKISQQRFNHYQKMVAEYTQ